MYKSFLNAIGNFCDVRINLRSKVNKKKKLDCNEEFICKNDALPNLFIHLLISRTCVLNVSSHFK